LKSEVVQLSQGNIEFSIAGNGPVVLISHGTLGGFDQGLAIAQLFDQEK
jgi:hypothetical protein